VITLLISAQTRDVWVLEALCSGGSEVIAAEMKQVIDRVVR